MTPFAAIYDAFFNLIEDDMYMEITQAETEEECEGILMTSLPLFEFPKQGLGFTGDSFDASLTLEEINILAYGMLTIWVQRQITTIETMRQKFSGPDFRFTSQATHLASLARRLQETRDQRRHLEMLYSRREVRNGRYESTMDRLVRRI